MNAPTLYAVLGVKSDATSEQIKKAYRRLSKRYHPDMPSGSAERFRDINTAFEVLTDTERRAFYDKHGRIEETQPEKNANADLYAIVQSALTIALKQGDPMTTDLVAEAARLLKTDVTAMTQNKAKAEAELKKLRSIQSRMIAKNGGDNMLAKIFEQQIGGMEAALANAVNGIALAGRAVEFLQGHEYKFDAPTPQYLNQRRAW